MHNQNTAHRLHWAWIIMAVCFLSVFINYSIRMGYAVILPEMIAKLNINHTQVGWIYNSYLLAYVCLAPFTGYLTDRLGGRRVITICCFILGLGTFCMGLAQDFKTACLFYALAGIGAAGLWTPVITVVQRWFTPQRRGFALGILGPSYGLGFAVTGLVFPWISHAFSWQYIWFFLGLGALAMSLINGIFLRSDPHTMGYSPWGGQTDPESAAAPSPAPVWQEPARPHFIRQPNFWLIGFSYLAASYCLYGITTFMIDYAKNDLHLANTSLLATIHGVAQAIGVLVILPLSDRWGRKKSILLADFVFMLFFFAILALNSSWLSLGILIGIMAVFYGAIWPLVGACGGDYFPKEVMGTVIGTWTLFYGSGAILTHWVTGTIRDITGGYQQAFLIDALMAGVALVLISFVKKDRSSSPGFFRIC